MYHFALFKNNNKQTSSDTLSNVSPLVTPRYKYSKLSTNKRCVIIPSYSSMTIHVHYHFTLSKSGQRTCV